MSRLASRLCAAALICAAACGGTSGTSSGDDDDDGPGNIGGVGNGDGGKPAPDPFRPACTSVTAARTADPSLVDFAAEYKESYKAFVLGTVPGIPPSRLGGTMLLPTDPNTLLIAVNTETQQGEIAQIKVKRDKCGHIEAFDGEATTFSKTPFVDANLLLGPDNVLFYSQWPVNKLSQIPLSKGTEPKYTIDLATLGVGGGGPGGIGFVPPNLADPGGLRAVTWPEGLWYHLAYAPSGGLFPIKESTQTTKLANGPGGFAYVPSGSPGFTQQSIIMSEWDVDKVVIYTSNEEGDPVTASRKEFFRKFPKPWGAYFEPQTGDFIFLTWGGAVDELYIVQGFATPPPPPEAPK